jgi:nicotinamide phosphoribosyltransferase
VLTIYNTKPEFYWLTNFLETLISNLLWKPMTSATIAHKYKGNLLRWARKTNPAAIDVGFVEFQGHDFSMRGMDSIDATISSGLGHASSFLVSDSLPVIHGARKYYDEESFVVGSVNATEHSVMCAGSKDGEIDTFIRLLDDFPEGILSVVSDTWDLWKVITEYLSNPAIKQRVLARKADGLNKLVIRPDSGDPVDILCGELRLEDMKSSKDMINKASDVEKGSARHKGVIELLWDEYGGTTNDQGYRVLDPRIGAIYGDSITVDRAEEICRRLEAKGFASTNVVLGIGSFTYQYNTRDTFGFAMKATYCEVNGEGREIFKDPVTDDGTKKSAKGLLKVAKKDGVIVLQDQVDWADEKTGCLQVVFENGNFHNEITLTEIREKLNKTYVS